MTLTRRKFLAIATALSLVPGVAQARQLSLDEISAYLNRFTTGQGGFTQINADGTISTGQIWIKRPGRIRFEYAPPDAGMFIAGGGQVAIFDPGSNEVPERYPLNQTPLNIILERNVDLARRGMVTAHESDGTTTSITAQDPAHPEYGSIRLVFTADPVQLRQWVVSDDGGSETTVILNDVQAGGTISDRRFNIQAEMAAWNP